MKKLQKKQAGLRRRHTRVRGKISGTAARPRLCITRSNSNMYAQVVFDRGGNLYHGRIKAVADGAREAGLKF